MKKKGYTHTEAFRYFGVTPRNIRYSWSGPSPDGQMVAVTVYDHEFRMMRGRYSFEGKVDMTRQGGRDLADDLQWALDHCGGRVHIIRAFARDPKADKPNISYCLPAAFTMKIAHFDRATGDYLLQIELPDQIAA